MPGKNPAMIPPILKSNCPAPIDMIAAAIVAAPLAATSIKFTQMDLVYLTATFSRQVAKTICTGISSILSVT